MSFKTLFVSDLFIIYVLTNLKKTHAEVKFLDLGIQEASDITETGNIP